MGRRQPKRSREFVVVVTTCGTADEASRIAQSLVEKRLAACVNIAETPVRSTYRWKGRVETAEESLLFIKSARRLFPALLAELQRLHSYDVPECIALPIVEGSPAYLKWLEESLNFSTQGNREKKKKTRA